MQEEDFQLQFEQMAEEMDLDLEEHQENARKRISQFLEDVIENPEAAFSFEEMTEDILKPVMDDLEEELGIDFEEEVENLSEKEKERLQELLQGLCSWGMFLPALPGQKVEDKFFNPVNAVVKQAIEQDEKQTRAVFYNTKIQPKSFVNGLQRTLHLVIDEDVGSKKRISNLFTAAKEIYEFLYKPLIILLGNLAAVSQGNTPPHNYGGCKDQVDRANIDLDIFLSGEVRNIRNAESHSSFYIRSNGVEVWDKDEEEKLGHYTEEELKNTVEDFTNMCKSAFVSLKKIYMQKITPDDNTTDDRE